MALRTLLTILSSISYTSNGKNYSISQWTRGKDPPRSFGGAAVAYSATNSIIWLIGDAMNGQGAQLMSFDITSNNYTDHGISYFGSKRILGFSQFYTQIDDYLYMIDYMANAERIIRFNVMTAAVDYNYDNMLIPVTPPMDSLGHSMSSYDGTCLSSMVVSGHEYLIVMGGGSHFSDCCLNNVQIYSLSDHLWLSNVAPMNKGRAYFACIMHENRLYAIGGLIKIPEGSPDLSDISITDTVEFSDYTGLSADTIASKWWTTLSSTFTGDRWYGRAVAIGSDIIVLSRISAQSSIDIIHTDSFTISNAGYWDDVLYCSTFIVTEAHLFLFGDGTGQWCGTTKKRMYSIDLPTQSPTKPPTDSPLLQPTAFPTEQPVTIAPTASTLTPTMNPSDDPTAAPSETTNAPTGSPTKAPSNAPSAPPTQSPTDAPSTSPSRLPTTHNPYDGSLVIVYRLEGLSSLNIEETVANNNAWSEIERLIERGYVSQTSFGINYYEFWCKMNTVHADNEEHLYLNTITECIEGDAGSCSVIQWILECDDTCKGGTFESRMTEIMRDYFANSEVHWTVISYLRPSEISTTNIWRETDENDENVIVAEDDSYLTSNYIFYGLLGFSLLFIAFGFVAYCYNDGICCRFPPIRGCYVVDDGSWTALIYFALHFYDFSSDINLCIEIWLERDIFNDILLLISGIGCVLFVICPYVINLYIASRITHHEVIRNNESASGYFVRNSRFFTMLCVLTGGCYASLVLISSNIFGISKFSSGLTNYHLKKLSKIRMVQIYTENIPQLIFQVLYTIAIGDIRNAVIFAFVASLLSILSTSTSYLIDRESFSQNTHAIEYCLVTQSSSLKDGVLSAENKVNILCNKGKRRRLSRHIAQLFGIQPTMIQIGNTMITKNGFITSVVHFYRDTDLLIVAEQDTATHFIDQLYDKVEKELNQIMRRDFKLEHHFHVNHRHVVNVLERAQSTDVHMTQIEGDQKATVDDTNATDTTNTLPVATNSSHNV